MLEPHHGIAALENAVCQETGFGPRKIYWRRVPDRRRASACCPAGTAEWPSAFLIARVSRARTASKDVLLGDLVFIQIERAIDLDLQRMAARGDPAIQAVV